MHGPAPGLEAVPATGAGLPGLHECTAGKAAGGAAEAEGAKQRPPLRPQATYPQRMALQKPAPRQIMGERNPQQWKCGPRTVRLGDSIWACGQSQAAMGLDMSCHIEIPHILTHIVSPILNIDQYLPCKTE